MVSPMGWVRARVDSFVFGFFLPFAALSLILRKPKLLAWSALPIALTLGLYFWVIARAQNAIRDALNAWIAGHGWDPSSIWAMLISASVSLALIVVGALSFSICSSVIAAPLNDFLAEATEPHTTPPLDPSPVRGPVAKARLIAIDIAKTLAAALAGVAALLLSWVPVLNLISFVLLCLLVAFQYVSYPQTRRGVGLVLGIAFLGRHFFLCWGFGASVTLLLAIPVVSCLFLPLAVVGGTLLYGHAVRR